MCELEKENKDLKYYNSLLKKEIEKQRETIESNKREIMIFDNSDKHRKAVINDYKMWIDDRKRLQKELEDLEMLAEANKASISELKNQRVKFANAGKNDVEIYKKQIEGIKNQLDEKDKELIEREFAILKEKKEIAGFFKQIETERSELSERKQAVEAEKRILDFSAVSLNKGYAELEKEKEKINRSLELALQNEEKTRKLNEMIAQELDILKNERYLVESQRETLEKERQSLKAQKATLDKQALRLESQRMAFMGVLKEYGKR